MVKLPWMLLLVAVVIVLGMGVAAYALLSQDQTGSNQNGSTVNELLDRQSERSCGLPAADSVAAVSKIEVHDQGFKPSEVTVRVGQTVKWQNVGQDGRRVASQDGPEHSRCFGLESDRLDKGDEYRFTFTKPGSWQFRDESSASSVGTVTVTE